MAEWLLACVAKLLDVMWGCAVQVACRTSIVVTWPSCERRLMSLDFAVNGEKVCDV